MFCLEDVLRIYFRGIPAPLTRNGLLHVLSEVKYHHVSYLAIFVGILTLISKQRTLFLCIEAYCLILKSNLWGGCMDFVRFLTFHHRLLVSRKVDVWGTWTSIAIEGSFQWGRVERVKVDLCFNLSIDEQCHHLSSWVQVGLKDHSLDLWWRYESLVYPFCLAHSSTFPSQIQSNRRCISLWH